jgi:chemotaxis protein MotB
MENQTIIVKKIKKGGHGHHGGAWKVAFADFVTAMMAFFLLLWLIASTTKEERAGISEYFSPPTQGLAAGSGTSSDVIDMGGGQKISRGDASEQNARQPTDDEIKKAVETERERLESLMEEIKKAIEASANLKPFKDQLLLDITPEGLRIQIVDKENRPMFDSGSAELKPYTKVILHELAKTINTVPNRLSLTGHTDAARFVGRENYSNWELSADRANASRRELIVGGLAAEKIAKVVGLASMIPFDKDNPRSPVNRRIAIIVMNRAAEEALLMESGMKPAAAETEVTDKRASSDEAPSEQAATPAAPKPAGKSLLGSVTDQRASEPAKAEQPKPKPKAKPKTQQKPKPAAHKVDLPPAKQEEPSFVDVPSPIAPINPIKLPSSPQ